LSVGLAIKTGIGFLYRVSYWRVQLEVCLFSEDWEEGGCLRRCSDGGASREEAERQRGREAERRGRSKEKSSADLNLNSGRGVSRWIFDVRAKRKLLKNYSRASRRLKLSSGKGVARFVLPK
jgi:hypothetical protein